MTKYKISRPNTQPAPEGVYDTQDEAEHSGIRQMGWDYDTCVLVEMPHGGEWVIYPDQASADSEADVSGGDKGFVIEAVENGAE
jgi:hypothetical protein